TLIGPTLLALLAGACALQPQEHVGDEPTAPETRLIAEPLSGEELHQAAREVGPDLLRRWRNFWKESASEITLDPNGNLQSLTPPGQPAHGFTYTPIDLEADYIPPDLGIGNVTTTRFYNVDRQLTRIARPDGVNVDFAYDSGGRLGTITFPGGPV